MKKKLDSWWLWFLCTIIFLVSIQILYTIPAPVIWMKAVWDAGDIISITGTLVLGYVALSQTKKANTLSELSMKLEEKANILATLSVELEKNRYKYELRPFAMVYDFKAYILRDNQYVFNPTKIYIEVGEMKDTETTLGVSLMLQNTTDSYISVEYSTAKSDIVNWTNSSSNQPNPKLRLLSGEKAEIVFVAGENFFINQIGDFIKVELILENRFAERYKEMFDLIITSLSNNNLKKEEWYLSVTTQNYEIGKFKKDSNGKILLTMEKE